MIIQLVWVQRELLNSDWSNIKNGLEKVDALMSTTPELGSVIATSIKLITGKDAPIVDDYKSGSEWAIGSVNYVKDSIMYNPIDLGDWIMSSYNDDYWNAQLEVYFTLRSSIGENVPSCQEPNFEQSPPCLPTDYLHSDDGFFFLCTRQFS